jgi:hypothetical protein
MLEHLFHHYLPQEIPQIYLGMSLEDFKLVKDLSEIEVDDNGYITYLTEDVEDPYIIQFIYQFDNQKILYEIIIQYKGIFDVQQYMTALYGAPNRGEEWTLESDMGEKIKIWRFSKSFCIALAKYFE